MSVPPYILAALMDPGWALVIITASSMLLGIVVNFIIVSYYIGTYKKTVDDVTEKLDKHLEEYTEFRRRYAALTGDANGH